MRKSGVIALSAAAMFAVTVLAEKAPESFQQAMKSNGATLQKLGKDVDAKDYDAVAGDASTLKKNFMEVVGKYWTEKKNEDGLNKCKAAFAASNDLEKAAKAKNDTGIADARKALGAACQGCHQAHREKLPDGSFDVK